MLSLAALVLLAAPAADGFEPLYNGRDLAGWVNVNCAPGTFTAKGDEIVTTGFPTGYMRREKPYENFVMEFEWKHVREKGMANSGLFVWGDALPAVGQPYTRGIEVQVLINFEVDWATSHGDIFSIWGATCVPDRPHPKGYARCLPSERRVKGAGEWNHYKVTANDGVIKLEVNGKEVSGVAKCKPRKGYIALESEGAECHFRNLKLKELPSTNPPAAEVATPDAGHKSLFDGLTLTGWTAEEKAWAVAGEKLKAKSAKPLATADKLVPGELVFDSRGGVEVTVSYGGLTFTAAPSKTWARTTATVTAEGLRVTTAGITTTVAGTPTAAPLSVTAADGVDLMNVFHKPGAK